MKQRAESHYKDNSVTHLAQKKFGGHVIVRTASIVHTPVCKFRGIYRLVFV